MLFRLRRLVCCAHCAFTLRCTLGAIRLGNGFPHILHSCTCVRVLAMCSCAFSPIVKRNATFAHMSYHCGSISRICGKCGNSPCNFINFPTMSSPHPPPPPHMIPFFFGSPCFNVHAFLSLLYQRYLGFLPLSLLMPCLSGFGDQG